MRLYQIFEARRNPHLNPRSDFVSELYYMMHKYRDNLFVSFTHLNKIGVNPQSKFNTPLGVYAYPASYVQKVLEERRYDVRNLPFAGDRPYVQFLESRGKGLDFDHYSYHDLEKDLQKLSYHLYGIKMSHNSFEELVKTKSFEQRSRFSERTASTLLWFILYIFSNINDMNPSWYSTIFAIEKLLINGEDTTDYQKVLERSFNKSPTVNWNIILNKILGYDYVVDFGHGIIHQSEPSQVVFLTNRGYKHVGVYELGQEGAEKTVDKYDVLNTSLVEDIIKAVKKDFPNVTQNTKLKDPHTQTDGLTIEQLIKRHISKTSYVNDEESKTRLIDSIKYILLYMEFADNDFNKNEQIYNKYGLIEEDLIGMYRYQLSYLYMMDVGIKSEDIVTKARSRKEIIIKRVHEKLAHEFNVEEWE